MSKKIAVIAGAGPAGLTAAYELIERTDIHPIVLETTDAIGGIAQTYNYKGNRIDIGGHRFFSKSDRVMDWWFNILPLQGAPTSDAIAKKHDIDYATEVVLRYLVPECAPKNAKLDGNVERRKAPDPNKEDQVMLQRPRISRIFYRRSFFPYPLETSLATARRLGAWNTVLIGLSYLRAQISPLKDETYLDAFFINRFGKRLYETFFKDYTEKVWGVPCSEIRADWGAQRIKGLSLKRAIATAVRDLLTSGDVKEQKERETSLITRFFYPKYGPGQMWETVARYVQVAGGEVRMQHQVVGVELDGNRVKAVQVKDMQSGEVQTLECDYFFSTMPIKHLIGMMEPRPPQPVVEVAQGLQYRDFLTVGLLLRKLHVQEHSSRKATPVLPDNWIYIQEGDVLVGRVQIFNNWSPYMAADPQRTVWIGLEYFVNEGDRLWSMSDEDLVQLGIAEMKKVGFIDPDDVLDGCVLRMPKAYPAYFGSYDALDVVREHVNGIENMMLIGRNGMHRYNNQDHSMLTAMVAVDNIVEGRADKRNLWEINLEMVYHEQKEKSAE